MLREGAVAGVAGGKVIVDGREEAMRKDAFTGLSSNG